MKVGKTRVGCRSRILRSRMVKDQKVLVGVGKLVRVRLGKGKSPHETFQVEIKAGKFRRRPSKGRMAPDARKPCPYPNPPKTPP